MDRREYNKIRYQQYKERYREQNKKWRFKHPNYYQEHKEELRVYQKKWKLKHPNYFKTPESRLKRKLYNQKVKRKKNLKRTLKRYNITIEEYKQITAKCCLCGFDKYRVDIHHIDKDKNNHNKNNLVGLCPNCHLGIHRGKIAEP